MTNKVGNIDRYKNFGLREEWLSSYLIDLDDYWTSNHGLNENYQIPSLKSWLKDAGFIDDKGQATEIAKLFADPDVQANYPYLSWEVAWVNLSYNSAIVDWFTQNVSTSIFCSQKGMEEMIREQFPAYKEKTVHNAVYQLRRTLKESPIGESLGQGTEIDKELFRRNGHEDLSKEAVVYSLYKYAEIRKINSLRIFDLYKDDATAGISKEFRTSKTVFEGLLRSLNSDVNRVIIAELNMGLDNITLRDDLNAITALKAVMSL